VDYYERQRASGKTENLMSEELKLAPEHAGGLGRRAGGREPGENLLESDREKDPGQKFNMGEKKT